MVFWIVTSSSTRSAIPRDQSRVWNCRKESANHSIPPSVRYLLVHRSSFTHQEESTLSTSLLQGVQSLHSHIGQTGLFGAQSIFTVITRACLVSNRVVHIHISFDPSTQANRQCSIPPPQNPLFLLLTYPSFLDGKHQRACSCRCTF